MKLRKALVFGLGLWTACLMTGQGPSGSEGLKPMRPEASPGFEVATVRLSDPAPSNSGSGFKSRGRHVYAVRENLIALVTFAYGLHRSQLVGAPSWADTENFDVNGEPDEPGVPNLDQMRSMYRRLLSDRFQLAFHRAKKQLPVYAIRVGKKGSRLKASARPGSPTDQTMNGSGHLRETNATMADFASMMQAAVLDRPVLNQTGLSGRFDFTLVWSPDQSPNDSRPSLTTAFEEQLGLKLAAIKAPAEVLIIDKVEKPSGN